MKLRLLERCPVLPSRRQIVITLVVIVIFAVVVWSLKLWFTTEYDLAGHRAAPHGIVFVDKHRMIATACADLHLYLFSTSSGTLLRRIGGHAKRLTSISTFKDASVVATGSIDGKVKIWSLPRGIEERSFSAHKRGVLSVRYSHDGSRLASVGKDKMIRVWSSESGGMISEIACPNPTGCLAMNASGNLVAAGGYGDDLVIWTTKAATELKRLNGDTPATSACFSPDGTFLAVGRQDGIVEIWHAYSWQCSQLWREHRAKVTDLALSLDGKELYTASGDGSVGVWNLEAGYLSGRIEGHPKEVLSVATSSSGAIATSGYGPFARIWNNPLAVAQ